MSSPKLTEDDHERIWLAPPCSDVGTIERCWCADASVFETCPDCGAEPTEYIRADLVSLPAPVGDETPIAYLVQRFTEEGKPWSSCLRFYAEPASETVKCTALVPQSSITSLLPNRRAAASGDRRPETPTPGGEMTSRKMTKAATDVLAERQRQVEAEGWALEHDDRHSGGEMGLAASCYAISGATDPERRSDLLLAAIQFVWPKTWAWTWWKPTDRRRDLVKAGALILAEIERLDRAALKDHP